MKHGHARVYDAVCGSVFSGDGGATFCEGAGGLRNHRVLGGAAIDPIRIPSAGVVSARYVVASIASGEEPRVALAAAIDPLWASCEEQLDRGAQLVAQRRVSRLVVLDAACCQPVGVLSPFARTVVNAAECRP